MIGERLPLLKQFDGAGGGAGNVKAHGAEARGYFLNLVFGERVEELQKFYVNSWHGHKHVVALCRHFGADLGHIEFAEKIDRRAAPEAAAENVNYPVNMMHRQE